MSNTQSNFKNPCPNHHTPNDTIYLKPIRLSCNFCNNTGPSKIRKNLWRLHCHFLDQHTQENHQVIEKKLYDLIEAGVLR